MARYDCVCYNARNNGISGYKFTTRYDCVQFVIKENVHTQVLPY